MNITSIAVLGTPIGVGVPAGELVELTYGQSLRINVSFGYRGPPGKARLYGAIGHRGIFFTEKLSSEAEIDLPDSPTQFTPCFRSVNIGITPDIDPGTGYDIYCKLREYPKAGLPEVDDVITITGIPPTLELLEETIYPYAYIYNGPHDGGIFTFKSDPFTPASWIAGKLSATVEAETRKAGGRLLEMRVYVDRSPLFWSDWRIEVITAPATTAGIAMALGIAWWAVAILLALAIALIIVITWSAKEIFGLFKPKVGLDEVKITWKKDTLIKAIQDSEEYWERSSTPLGTLQGMSEEDLRHYLNKIAEEEVPPGVSWLPLAVAGGLGVLGIGVVLALAARPRE